MSAPARFKQVDIARMYKALTGAGMRVARVEISPDGTIAMIPESAGSPTAPNPWDQEFEDLAPYQRKRPK